MPSRCRQLRKTQLQSEFFAVQVHMEMLTHHFSSPGFVWFSISYLWMLTYSAIDYKLFSPSLHWSNWCLPWDVFAGVYFGMFLQVD